MIWKTTNGLGQEVTWYKIEGLEEMDKKHIKFIKAIEDLRIIIMKSTKQDEVDFLLESLHEKGEAIRKKDIGFWDINGNYIEDYQEITENDIG